MPMRDYMLISAGVLAGWSYDGLIHRSASEVLSYGLMACICGFAIWLATPHKNANTLT
jgi:hypothetical protein